MMFASGCFVPVSMLPEMLADVVGFDRHTGILSCADRLLQVVSASMLFWLNLAYSALFLALSAAVEKIILQKPGGVIMKQFFIMAAPFL